jgi:LuxR family maltose regulon positive regulatory protein
LDLAESANNTRQVIATLVLQSLVLQALERPRAGQGYLRRAIELAESRDFRRVFLDEGVPLVPMLKELARKGVAPNFISHLLAEMPEPEGARPLQPKAELRPTNLELIEALTYRELDVLELLALRLSNQEIAEKLVISAATARTHLANIYQKLQVGSRRQAVLRARELGIL